MKPLVAQFSLVGIAILLAIGNLIQYNSNRELHNRVASLEDAAIRREALPTKKLAGDRRIEKSPSSKDKGIPDEAAGGPGEPKLVAAKPAEEQGEESFSSLAEKYAKSVKDNPAIQKQMLKQFEAQLGDVLDDLYTHFELEGEELDHFKGLMAEHWRVQSQVPMKLMSAMGDPDKTSALKENLRESREATDARIEEFLNSDEDYAYYETYRDQIPDRMEVNQYKDTLEADGQQLTPDQEAQLIAAMAEERKASGLGDLNDPVNWDMNDFNEDTLTEVMGQMSDFHRRVQSRAGAILEQEQVTVMAESQSDIRQQQELGMRFGLQMMKSMRPKDQAEGATNGAGAATE